MFLPAIRKLTSSFDVAVSQSLIAKWPARDTLRCVPSAKGSRWTLSRSLAFFEDESRESARHGLCSHRERGHQCLAILLYPGDRGGGGARNFTKFVRGFYQLRRRGWMGERGMEWGRKGNRRYTSWGKCGYIYVTVLFSREMEGTNGGFFFRYTLNNIVSMDVTHSLLYVITI